MNSKATLLLRLLVKLDTINAVFYSSVLYNSHFSLLDHSGGHKVLCGVHQDSAYCVWSVWSLSEAALPSTLQRSNQVGMNFDLKDKVNCDQVISDVSLFWFCFKPTETLKEAVSQGDALIQTRSAMTFNWHFHLWCLRQILSNQMQHGTVMMTVESLPMPLFSTWCHQQ